MSTIGQLADRAARDVAYLTVAMLTACLALAVWVTGLTLVISLAVFIVGVLVVIPVAKAFEWTCNLDRVNARLAGVTIGSKYVRAASGDGFIDRIKLTARDPQRWRDLAWLLVHSVVGFTFGVVVLSLIFTGLVALSLPVTWDHWPSGDVVWAWLDIDSQAKAWAGAGLGLVWLIVTLGIARALTVVHVAIAKALLSPISGRPQPTMEMPETAFTTEAAAVSEPGWSTAAAAREIDSEDMNRLLIHGAVSAVISALMVVIWMGSGFGTFWPVWVWLALALGVAAHVMVLRARQYPGDWLRLAFESSVVISAACVIVWVFSGFGTFWPFWVVVGLGTALAGAAAFVLKPWEDRDGLMERVETLVRTRRETVDAQANELRRIERDLHDGAQARLVALSMQLGRAEARLGDRPEEAELVRAARAEASAAIGELRDLARGIAPPVLADRGLVAAVDALCQRSAVEVTLTSHVSGRLPLAVESCAYFVCAEGLTNVAKHADGATAEVVLRREGGLLVCEVCDDGPGGADPTSPGLTGLRQRVAALDGRLLVDSPSGAGTTIRAEIPCA